MTRNLEMMRQETKDRSSVRHIRRAHVAAGRRLAMAVIVCWASLAGASSASGQDALVSELYGEGVHHYFNGEFQKAADVLAEAVEQEAVDPRVYYFRGLALARLGDEEAADEMFEQGAEVEMTREESDLFGVSRSLQRVQGPLRLKIEEHRRQASIDAERRRVRLARLRYERLRRAEDEVLLDLEREKPDVQVELPEEALTSPDDPFVSGRAFSGGDVTETTPADDTSEAPPGGEGTPVAPPDPFETPGAAPVTNPFGNPPAGDSPPGDAPPVDPFGNPPAGDAPPVVDPFGNPADADPPGAPPTVPGGLPPAGRGVIGGIFDALKQAVDEQETPSRDPFADPSEPNFGGPPPGGNPPETDDGSDNPTPPAEDPFGNLN